MQHSFFKKRSSGVLLHISSLPSSYGIGDLGDEAYQFIDLIASNGFKVWQILPFGPVGSGNSPYQSYSSYAGEPMLISPNELVKLGLLTKAQCAHNIRFKSTIVEFEKVRKLKFDLFKQAYQTFKTTSDFNLKNEYQAFRNEHNWWLIDFATFYACKNANNNLPWNEWPISLAQRDTDSLVKLQENEAEEFNFQLFLQFMFFRQWFRLKEYANSRNVLIFGDLPLYVSHNSVDVWSNQTLFLLDKNGNSETVGGVPPDYFCEDGQLWGNPVYNWETLKASNFHWWIARLYFNFHLFNIVRIDHFRGLQAFWAIEADAETAKNGEWKPAMGDELLQLLTAQLGQLPIVAEDLGLITPEVDALREKYDLPGMKVLQFAFGSNAENTHLPHNFTPNNIVYTGTHDNNTLKGWLNECDKAEIEHVKKYTSKIDAEISNCIEVMAWASTAKIAIIPLQDVLELGSEARFNIPGTPTGNWNWRLSKNQLSKKKFDRFAKLNKLYNR